MVSQQQRFATVSTEEKENILKEKSAKNSLKQNRVSLTVLRKYCHEKNIPFNPVEISPLDLDVILQSFYVEVRKEDGGHYKKTSFSSLRNGK